MRVDLALQGGELALAQVQLHGVHLCLPLNALFGLLFQTGEGVLDGIDNDIQLVVEMQIEMR